MAGKLEKIFKSIFGSSEGISKMPVFNNPPPPPPKAYLNTWTVSYTGEKNFGEIGPVKDYRPEYEVLRLRSWQAYLESEIAQTVLKKFTKWVIGSGLKLMAEPSKVVLKYEKIEVPTEEFNEVTEARFSTFAKFPDCDYSEMMNLHLISKEAFINSIIGGDSLIILRYIDSQVKIQLIDGAHVCSPPMSHDFHKQSKANGNEIRHGIELSPRGKHIAFYIKKGLFDYERVEAVGKESGLTMAFLIYGLRYRLDSVRGLPLISAVLESLKKLERYKEATVGSAEERQKIVYSIEHQLGSTGESPLASVLAKAYNVDGVDDIPVDSQGNQLADKVAVSTNKQVINMPINSQLKALESKNELYFKDFYSVNIDLVCAALGIPPEVAMSKYDSNFSASRAALKDWEHTINVDRSEFSFQFYQKIYNFWLETEILKNKIQAPGYITAKMEGNATVINAYRNARFVGSNIPHVDPVKEVEAVRRKLGEAAASIPLITLEQATEELGGGDSDQNMSQFAEELKEAKRLEIVPEPVPVVPPSRG